MNYSLDGDLLAMLEEHWTYHRLEQAKTALCEGGPVKYYEMCLAGVKASVKASQNMKERSQS